MEQEQVAKVVYKGTLSGPQYTHSEYTLDAGEEYEMPVAEAQRLLADFGPTHFAVKLPIVPGAGKEGGAPEGKEELVAGKKEEAAKVTAKDKKEKKTK